MAAAKTDTCIKKSLFTKDVITAYQRGMRNLPREHDFEPLTVEGVVPHDLRGVYYLSGPALFSLFDREYRHWFDGDGAITAIRFGGNVTGAVRLIESAELKKERRAGRPLYTSGSTLAPQWWRRIGLRFKNAANTKPLIWNNRLFSLFEASMPTEVNLLTLSTIGETSLGGVIKGAFSAHFHGVASRNAFYNFSVERGRRNMLHLYELSHGGNIRRISSLPLPKNSSMLHDFIATEKHLVFFIPPVAIRSVFAVLAGVTAPTDAMEWRPGEGTTVLVVPIDAPEKYKFFKTNAFFQYHFMNAYEQGDQIIIDFVRVMNFESAFNSHRAEERKNCFPTEGRLFRATVNSGDSTIQLEQRWDQPCEFPQVAPIVQGIRHRFGYLLASREGEPQTKIAKVDYESGHVTTMSFPPNQFPSEAVFVPRAHAKNEDDGYLISLVYDSDKDRSFLAVFDARELTDAPRARLWFDHHIPRPIHGTWSA